MVKGAKALRVFIKMLRKNERGQALVEFALVIIPLMLLVLGIVEFGWLLNGQITVTSSAREGARLAAVSGTRAQVESAVTDHLAGSGIVIDNIAIETDEEADTVTVTVRGVIEPLVGFFVRGAVPLSAAAVMRWE